MGQRVLPVFVRRMFVTAEKNWFMILGKICLNVQCRIKNCLARRAAVKSVKQPAAPDVMRMEQIAGMASVHNRNVSVLTEQSMDSVKLRTRITAVFIRTVLSVTEKVTFIRV